MPKQHSTRERGQSMVEFALTMSVLMLIAVGVLDLGRLYMTYVALQNAAGEGAMYGSIHPTWITDCPTAEFGCNDPAVDNITARTRNEAPQGTLVDWNSATILVEYPDGGTEEGMHVRVRVQYTYQMFTPILSRIWPTLPLEGLGSQGILGGN
jgi:Flp pilus assembly protein TadG